MVLVANTSSSNTSDVCPSIEKSSDLVEVPSNRKELTAR